MNKISLAAILLMALSNNALASLPKLSNQFSFKPTSFTLDEKFVWPKRYGKIVLNTDNRIFYTKPLNLAYMDLSQLGTYSAKDIRNGKLDIHPELKTGATFPIIFIIYPDISRAEALNRTDIIIPDRETEPQMYDDEFILRQKALIKSRVEDVSIRPICALARDTNSDSYAIILEIITKMKNPPRTERKCITTWFYNINGKWLNKLTHKRIQNGLTIYDPIDLVYYAIDANSGKTDNLVIVNQAAEIK